MRLRHIGTNIQTDQGAHTQMFLNFQNNKINLMNADSFLPPETKKMFQMVLSSHFLFTKENVWNCNIIDFGIGCHIHNLKYLKL